MTLFLIFMHFIRGKKNVKKNVVLRREVHRGCVVLSHETVR